MYINLLLFCCCAVTVVCFVTDIIIECMKILLLLFCILTWYIYLSPLQFAPYINHPFIVCLYISISADDSYYLFIQCANVLSCCHGDYCPCFIVARMTCPPSLAVFVNLYTSFVSFISHCASMSKFKIPCYHGNLTCSTIMRSG